MTQKEHGNLKHGRNKRREIRDLPYPPTLLD